MTRKIILSLTMFVLAIFLLVPSLALAGTITLSLSNPVQSATPGSTLTFDATVSAPSTNAAPIFLNSDNYTIGSPLTLDDSDFFSFPLSLDPGDSYTGALFNHNPALRSRPGRLHGLLRDTRRRRRIGVRHPGHYRLSGQPHARAPHDASASDRSWPAGVRDVQKKGQISLRRLVSRL